MSDNIDLESLPKGGGNEISRFSWKGLTVTVKDSKTKEALDILKNAEGCAQPGDMVALMGPSGSGKTTLLNVLARRPAAASASVKGQVHLDNAPLQAKTLREISTYVEQEDALIGSLTVQETIEFAARLSGTERHGSRVSELIRAFGLAKQAHTKIGTPVAKGISGGQKRRVSIASQLITRPKILFLDEPTSGLDSKAAYEVMYRIRQVARDENMIVIASIHQPTAATFNLFSQLVLLSSGRLVYSGPTDQVVPYFSTQGVPIPPLSNPAEFLLDVCNTDFDNSAIEVGGEEGRIARLDRLMEAWSPKSPATEISSAPFADSEGAMSTSGAPTGVPRQTLVLLQRLWLKSYRDLLAYWIRVIMYLGLAFMMGTVWLRLGREQDNIQPFINAIFFSGAFMSFMAVAYIPAYLEDHESFRKERANGLYGPTAFLLSNFLIGIPFIFLIALLFSLVTVFLCNFRQTPEHFFRYVMWLFLDLLAAESLVVLISSLIPVFVAALAITAFANGLWMSVSGFLVSPKVLNNFWYYTFHWIDYQRYVFQGMMFNEFDGRVYNCERVGDECQCMYPSGLSDQCKIEGRGVLTALGYGKKDIGLWIGILLAVIVGMRGLAWITLKVKRN
ncbi:P-loop containing nucleoside triphosphate hydrolase protein [Tuber magnatum]|uniref:P-loop containing nucleoside triphosphate hydrolase protein n=1 Tax=Tuber magnatum TaxID=42249 RepID=A0A317SNR2_9PEZI|nr:P-loop containing nucleoside triphosphate hydrolase protein [Tuber magnatum]